MQPTPDQHAEAIRETTLRWRAAAVADDVDLYFEFIAENAVFIAPGQEPFVGKPAVSAFVRGALEAISVVEVLENADPVASGEVGYQWGTYDATYTVKADGSQIHELGNHLFLWRLQPAGGWMLEFVTWNVKPEPEEAPE